MMGFINVDESTYMPVNGFTTVDLGCERGNNAYYVVNRTEAAENGQTFLRLFDEIWNDPNRVQDVTELVVDSISTAYRENAPQFIYFFTLLVRHGGLQMHGKPALPQGRAVPQPLRLQPHCAIQAGHREQEGVRRLCGRLQGLCVDGRR